MRNIQEIVCRKLESVCPRGSRLLLCVSGGIDSMVMLDIILKNGWDISVAHCNFSLRGEESDGDENLVRNVCREKGVELNSVRFDTHGYSKEHGVNTQIAARELRYEYFRQLADEHGFDYIVVAHHLDDSIETFFINLLRGTGLRGLSGISEKRNNIIRPMLGITREEITDYALTHGIPYRNDSSNSEDHYLRNRIRHHIVPLLKELSGGFMETMNENMARLASTERFVESVVNNIRNDVFTEDNAIDVSKLLKYNEPLFVLFEILQQYGFSDDVTSQIFNSVKAEATGKWFIGNGYRVLLERGYLRIIPEACSSFHIKSGILPLTINENSPQVSFINSEDITSEEIKGPHRTDSLFDADTVKFPLTVRMWKAGDRIRPLGMKGSKTVGDYLTDRKVSLSRRENILVMTESSFLESNEDEKSSEVVWIVGHQIGDRYKITPRTKRVLRLDLSDLTD